MATKDLTHSPIWFVAVLGTFAIYILDVEEAYQMFSKQGIYTKTTFDSLRSFGGHLFMDDQVNEWFWGLIYITWPLMLLYLVSTFFKQTSKGYLYKAGHMHCSFLFLAIGSLWFHMKWLKNTHEQDLSASLWSCVISYLLIISGFLVLLTYLSNKADEVISAGAAEEITIMRYVIINIYDFYVLHMLFNTLVMVSTYMVSAYDFTPESANYYVMLVSAILQVYFLFSDIYLTNPLTHYLAGGYITIFVDSFAIMLYQMNTLPQVPMISVINFLISAAMPALKIYLQSKDSGKSKAS